VGAAHRGRVEQHVDQVVGEEVDLVGVEDPPVRGGEQAGVEGRGPVAQRAVEVERAEQAVGGRADGQLDERDGALGDRRAGGVVGAVRAREAVDLGVGVEAAAGDDAHGREQRREAAHRGGLRGPALAADEHAADPRVHRAGQQRLGQRLLGDERAEREGRVAHDAGPASSSSPSACR
jgi:hypothetical protein